MENRVPLQRCRQFNYTLFIKIGQKTNLGLLLARITLIAHFTNRHLFKEPPYLFFGRRQAMLTLLIFNGLNDSAGRTKNENEEAG